MPNKIRNFLFGTLRRQLILGVAITHAILMSSLLLDLTQRQEAMFLERQKEHAIALTQSLALSSAGWVAANDIGGLQELVDSQKRYPELMYSMLTNSEGRILAHNERQKVGLTLLDLPKNAQEIIFRADKNLIDIAAPVMLAGKHVGWSRVGVGQGIANQKINKITHEGIIYALLAILLGTLMAWLMGRKITQRLHSIQKVMLDVKAGNSQKRILLDGNDEASVLAREFNGMLDKVAQREQDLNNSNEQLEERVKERTAEIVKSVNTLREQAELLNLTSDSIIVRTLENVITYWNKGAEQQYGWKAQEVVGKDTTHDLLKTIFPIPLNEINDILLHTNYWEGELTHTRRDGSRLVVASRWALQKNDNDEPIAIMEINNDITYQKKAEEEKLTLEHQFQHTQKLESLGVLSGGIAHDFNNILAIIMGYCSLTKMDYETAENNIQEIEKAAERAAGLCRQMLAYAGKAQLTMSQINMWMLVDEMVTMLKSTLPQNAEINPYLSTHIPYINGDASQIRQVVMNLIINASEAIGKEHGEIRVSLATTAIEIGQSEQDYNGNSIPPGEYICLEVTDNGSGMDEETRWRIFEPFYTTKFTGRGLGMSAVLGIIKSHGGALQLYSQLGQGTTFKVYLPVPKKNSTEYEGQKQFIPSAPWQGSGTILLVEDEEQIRLIAKALLKKFGFTVLEAVNGKEALELYQRNATDITLVMTDMGMPIMDGYELFHQLKKINPKLPIIVSSGYGDAEVSSRIDIDDIAGLISKPYNPNQLREVLKRVVESLH